MADDELRETMRKLLAESTFWTGERDVSVEDMAVLFAPALGTLMLEVGQRTWTLYYAAQAGNWSLARSQWERIQELIERGSLVRPQYAPNLDKFLAEDWPPLHAAIESQDFSALDVAFKRAIDQANSYHDLEHRRFIRWVLPDSPPPGLDLTVRGEGRGRPPWVGGQGGRPQGSDAEGGGGRPPRPDGEGGGGRPQRP